METPKGFSETKKDLGELQKTAVDAARDLGSTAAVHAEKARDQLSDLASDFQQEAPDQLNRVRASFGEVVKSGLDYVAAKPATSLGIAAGIGVIIGLIACASCRCDRD